MELKFQQEFVAASTTTCDQIIEEMGHKVSKGEQNLWQGPVPTFSSFEASSSPVWGLSPYLKPVL